MEPIDKTESNSSIEQTAQKSDDRDIVADQYVRLGAIKGREETTYPFWLRLNEDATKE